MGGMPCPGKNCFAQGMIGFMRALLTIESGHGEPRVFDLDPAKHFTLGRHRNNMIVLQDEHASRWHAEIFQDAGRWFIRDLSALNGTRLNGEAIGQQAALENNQVINIGKTTLRFTEDRPGNGGQTTSEFQLPARIDVAPGLDDLDQTVLCKDELATLCQFMADSLKTTEPRALIQRALELIRVQTAAAVAGYLSLDREDPLPKLVLPALSQVDLHLSRRLTEEVERRGRMVWLGAGPTTFSETESLQCFKDALCVPLQAGETPLGAVHIYKTGRLFSQAERSFCEVLVGHLANSLHLLRVHRNLQAENSRLRSHAPTPDQLIGSSSAIQTVRQKIARLGPHPTTVLIVGESGAGKELVALGLHAQSPRREGPLVSVNCAAIATTLLESELFGHCKGAFSGADRDHPGYFQQADEGTLFLDEVGELSLECQAKLLRVIEGKGIRSVGATAEVAVNVRLITATNRDLEAEVQAKRFRQDLFFRLQGFQIRVPPLREHQEDIPELVAYFLSKFAGEWGRQVECSPSALERLRGYSWPGNVRQLRSVLENAIAFAERDVLEPGDLQLSVGAAPDEPPTLNLDELENWAIRQALRRTEGNVTQAARVLGIARDTLTNKMKKYGISREET
jgi:Nif-specific regulatory protein